MKKFKRFLAVMLTAVMLITAAPLTGFALSEEKSLGYLLYDINNDEIAITGCDKSVSGELTIPSTIGGHPVTSIGSRAFYNCSKLTGISIPESIKRIGACLVDGCSSLKKITYNAIDAYRNEENYAFGLSTIESVVFGENVKQIPRELLSHCAGIKNVVIPNSVTSIGNYAFYGCTALTSITIPENVTSVGYGAFNGCDSLKELNYNATSAEFYEDYYNSYPFGYLTSIERVTIGENVTSIPDGFLRACSGFNNIIIPDSVTRIGNDAFYGCTALTSITIPENVTSVGYGAFNGCDSLKDLNYNATSAIFELEDWGYNSPFEKMQSIERVTIGENVTSLPDCFLRGCTGFNNIIIPDSVTNIGRSAFQGCIGISDIIIPENVSDIGDHAFCGCSSLTSVIIPENVKSIGDGAFSDSVSTVYFNAINCNTARDSFTGSINGITISFGGSTVKNMIISDKVQSLPSRIFYDCDELTEIKIPASVTYIGDRAFSNCEKLTNVIFSGDGEIELGNEIFNASYNATICCKENSYMHFYAEKMGLNYCILNENNDPTFTIKNDVLISYSGNDENLFFGSASKIGFGAFKDNTDLKSVELSSNVTRIYNQAFKNCTGLEKIIIPQSVASIGEDAFAGCDKLTVWCYAGSFAEAYAVNHEIPIKYITLNLSQDEVNLTQYETATLCASFNIDLSDNADMVWTSDNPSVVTVTSGGKITAVGVGEAVITATSANGLYAKCIVKVSKVEPKGSIKSVSLDDVEMKYKDTKQLYPIIEADDGVDYTVTYTSSDNSVARVDESGNVYAAKRGSADITVTVSDGFGNTITDTCSVKVNYSFWQWVIKILLFGWIWY